jgi:hypothetical protein
MNINHCNVRNMLVCVRCGEPKSAGLVICWPCHRAEKRDNDGGYSGALTAKLDRIERGLSCK